MTSVEKEMNKDELVAYKNYDNKGDLSLVPGAVSTKRFADPRPQKYNSPQHNSGKAAVALNEEKI